MNDLGLSEVEFDEEASAAVWLLVFLLDSTMFDVPGRSVKILQLCKFLIFLKIECRVTSTMLRNLTNRFFQL
jgi:hypothetical protein